MQIRKEREEDYPLIHDMIKNAFKTTEHSDGNEQDLVEKLRKSSAYIKDLTLVCVENEEIVGFIMFTKNRIGETEGLSLAPLAVTPEYQHRRLGTLLVKQGLKLAKDMGYEYVIVLGNNKYYSRFGFISSKEFGIQSPFDVPNKNFMAINLQGKKNKLNAMVEYPKEFYNN